jgi:hypothetical protein
VGVGEKIVNIQPNLPPADFCLYTRKIRPRQLISGAFNHFPDTFLFVFLNIFSFFAFFLRLSSRISCYSTAILSQYVMCSEPLGNLQ